MGALKDYFSFSKIERTGTIVLVLLVVGVFVLPEFFHQKPVPIDAAMLADLQQLDKQSKKVTADSTGVNTYKSNDVYKNDDEQTELFPFDPNTLSAVGWKKLGFTDRNIKTISNYLAKGGSFRKPEDLGKIYGLSPRKLELVIPYIRIKEGQSGAWTTVKKSSVPEILHPPPRKPFSNDNSRKQPAIIEINEADTSMFIALPGIGSKLAMRIVKFREKLGGFTSVEQMKEIYGLQDSLFVKARPFLICDTSRVNKININTVDAETLKNHPYIKWNIGNAIINYRQQHGEFRDIESLLQIDLITRENFEKIVSYVKVR